MRWLTRYQRLHGFETKWDALAALRDLRYSPTMPEVNGLSAIHQTINQRASGWTTLRADLRRFKELRRFGSRLAPEGPDRDDDLVIVPWNGSIQVTGDDL